MRITKTTGTFTIEGVYGSQHTPCEVICAKSIDGGTWYAVDGSQNVNCTYDEIGRWVDVEQLNDADGFTWPDGICSEEELEEAVED